MIDLKDVFLNATSPDPQIRSEAEALLKSFTKQPGFIIELTKYFNDPDIRIKLISSIFFKNFTIAEWSQLEFQPQKELILQNIVVLYASADVSICKNLEQLIEFVLEKEEPSRWNVITEPCMRMLQDQSNLQNIKAALGIVACIAKNDTLKYDSDKSEAMIGPIFPYLVTLLQYLTERREYESSKIIMKLATHLQNPYTSPLFTKCTKTISDIYRVAIRVISIEDTADDEVLFKYKKWCVKFFTRILTKYTQSGNIETKEPNSAMHFVLDQNNANQIFKILIAAVKFELRDGPEISDVQEKFLNAIIGYLNTVVSNKKIKCEYIKTEIIYIIFCFILPQMIFNSDDEDKYDNEPEVYLRDKYNYYATDFRGFSTILFAGIMKKVKNDEQINEAIFANFLKIFDEYCINPTPDNAKMKYGALQLVTTSSKFVLMNYNTFILKYLLQDFNSPYKYLRAQACYAIQSFKQKNINDNTMNQIYNGVMSNLNHECMIVSAESLLSVQFFMKSQVVSNRLKEIVPNIIQKVIEIQSKCQFEALDDLIRDITYEFPNEICVYFPQIVKLFCSNIIAGLKEVNEDNISTFTIHLESIIYLLDALNNNKELVYNLFCICAEMLCAVFTSQIPDLHDYAIDLFSEILVSFGGVDDLMLKLFSIVMTLSDDYKISSASFLVSLIDNFVSFGKEKVFNEIQSILNFIKILCKPEDNCYQEEEYQYGCQIIDSLLLNHSNRVAELIPFFIDNLMHHYHEIDSSSCYIIFHLDSLLNCFIVNFSHTWSILSTANHIRIFFNDLYNARNKFVRVYDKKLIIIFVSLLLKAEEKLIADIDIPKFIKTFINNLETLPDAITKREKLIEKKYSDDDEVDEIQDEQEQEDYYDDLTENEYMFTPIDFLNVFSILNNSVNSLGGFGVNVFNNMSEKDKNLTKEMIMKYA